MSALSLEALGDLTVINPVYEDSWKRPERHIVLCGGAGSGKSVFVAQQLISCAGDDKASILALRKVRNRCRDSTFKEFQNILSAMGMIEVVEKNKMLMTLGFESGGFIFHHGLDNTERLKSITGVDIVWVEEASECTAEDLKQIDLRVRGLGKKQIIYTMNPVGGARRVLRHVGVPEEEFDKLNHTGKVFVGNMGKVWVKHTTAADNPFAGEQYAAVLSGGMGEEWEKIYKDGKLGSEGSFDQVIPHAAVKKALAGAGESPDDIMRMGVDPARGGDDTAIAILKGTRLVHIERFKTPNSMKVVSAVDALAKEYGVRDRYIGVDALGLGGPVFDRLQEMGHKNVVEIKSGNSPIDAPHMFNTVAEFTDLRSQMWWFTREMFIAGKVSLNFDGDEKTKELLREDLVTPRYRALSDKRVQVEPKLAYGGSDRRAGAGWTWGVRERIGRSTDCGDAFIYALCVDLVSEPDWVICDEVYDDDEWNSDWGD